MLEISKMKLMLLLPHLLTGNVGYQYRVAANDSRSGNICGIFHCPETVKHLLRTFATEKPITNSLEEFEDICQNENENVTDYAAKLNNTA